MTYDAFSFALRISDIARLIGQPQQQLHHQAGVHRCCWDCGCEAVNTRGLCIEEGWSYAPCLAHPAAVQLLAG